MDEQSKKNIQEIEARSKFPTGIGRIDRRQCPEGHILHLACMLCPFGHMLKCHYPQTCEEAKCSHYQQETTQEDADEVPYPDEFGG